MADVDQTPASSLLPNRRVTRADRALTDMYEHLTWLREHRDPPSGQTQHRTDLAREVGAMDILRKHGARLIEQEAS